MKDFFSALTRDIILPLLAPTSSIQDGVTKLQIQFGSIKINIGDVIAQLINLVVAFALIYFTYPLLKEYVPVVGRR